MLQHKLYFLVRNIKKSLKSTALADTGSERRNLIFSLILENFRKFGLKIKRWGWWGGTQYFLSDDHFVDTVLDLNSPPPNISWPYGRVGGVTGSSGILPVF